MPVSKKLIAETLGRFALLADAPKAAQAYPQNAIDCWAGLMPVDMSDEQFSRACRMLALELNRYPTPADVLAMLPRVSIELQEVCGAQS
jgi:hypothetical protein